MRRPGQGGVAGLGSNEGGFDSDMSDSESETTTTNGSRTDDGHGQKDSERRSSSGNAPPAAGADAETPCASDDDPDSDDEAELKRELEMLKNRSMKTQDTLNASSNPIKPKKRSWTDETVFSGREHTEGPSYHVNDAVHSAKNKKFLNKYIR